MYTKQEAIDLCNDADKDWGDYYCLYFFKYYRKRYQTYLVIAFDAPDGKYKDLTIPSGGSTTRPVIKHIYLPFMYKGVPCEIGFRHIS